MKTGSSWLRLHFSLISLNSTVWWGLATGLSLVSLLSTRHFLRESRGTSALVREKKCQVPTPRAAVLPHMMGSTGLPRKWPCKTSSSLMCWICFFFSLLVSVGYEYESCPGAVQWERRTALMHGFELVPSNLGGWSLDKHHALNIRSGENYVLVCLYCLFRLQNKYCIMNKNQDVWRKKYDVKIAE